VVTPITGVVQIAVNAVKVGKLISALGAEVVQPEVKLVVLGIFLDAAIGAPA
jgi:hypothetical protein